MQRYTACRLTGVQEGSKDERCEGIHPNRNCGKDENQSYQEYLLQNVFSSGNVVLRKKISITLLGLSECAIAFPFYAISLSNNFHHEARENEDSHGSDQTLFHFPVFLLVLQWAPVSCLHYQMEVACGPEYTPTSQDYVTTFINTLV